MKRNMYSPCIECLNRCGRQYSEACDGMCDYAYQVKKRREAEAQLERAYQVIGELREG